MDEIRLGEPLVNLNVLVVLNDCVGVRYLCIHHHHRPGLANEKILFSDAKGELHVLREGQPRSAGKGVTLNAADLFVCLSG